MNPANRLLKQVAIEDAERHQKSLIFSWVPKSRPEKIHQTHAKNVKNLVFRLRTERSECT